MSDYFFKHFYDSVKDPSWPEVNNYSDFVQLPKRIVEECYQIHDLSSRLAQFEDSTYWKNQSALNLVYAHKNVAYLPVPKCASSSYTNLFRDQLGWQSKQMSDLDLTQIKVFSLIINPLTRRLKGIVESLYKSFNYNDDAILTALDNQSFLDFVSRVMTVDNHTTPYSLVFESWFDLVHWIPIDLLTPQQVKKEMLTFFYQNNVQIDLPETKKLNVSNQKRKLIQQMIQTKIMQTEAPAELGLMFAKDTQLYNKLVVRYAAV